MTRKKVIIVGSGFGGLNAALKLKHSNVDVLILDKANHHVFQPLLYQIASAAISPGNIASPIREILSSQKNVHVLLAEVTGIDKDEKKVFVENGESFLFDYLILAPGASHSYFNHREWEPFAPGLKTINDAIVIREKILLSFEKAEKCIANSEKGKFLTFVIVGAGPTGVEMAGAIAEMAHHSLTRNFRNINPDETEVFLIEGEKQVLPSYSEELSSKAKLALEKLNVTVLLNTRVTDVRSDGILIGEKFIPTVNVIWAAGNRASPLLEQLDTKLDCSGRAIVNSDLTIDNYDNIFVIGDAASFLCKNGKPLPGIAPVAIQEAKYVAKLISNEIKNKTTRKPFVYFDKGTMATIGKNKAVAKIGNFEFSGYFAWLLWCFIHIMYLISFSNRFLVMFQWFWLYITDQRRIRLITRPFKWN